jgi:hypothetical protein
VLTEQVGLQLANQGKSVQVEGMVMAQGVVSGFQVVEEAVVSVGRIVLQLRQDNLIRLL